MKCEDCGAGVPTQTIRAAEKVMDRPVHFRTDKRHNAADWTLGVDGRWWCSTCLARHTVQK